MSITTFTILGLVPIIGILLYVPMGLTAFAVTLVGSVIVLGMVWGLAVRLFTGEWPEED